MNIHEIQRASLHEYTQLTRVRAAQTTCIYIYIAVRGSLATYQQNHSCGLSATALGATQWAVAAIHKNSSCAGSAPDPSSSRYTLIQHGNQVYTSWWQHNKPVKASGRVSRPNRAAVLTTPRALFPALHSRR